MQRGIISKASFTHSHTTNTDDADLIGDDEENPDPVAAEIHDAEAKDKTGTTTEVTGDVDELITKTNRTITDTTKGPPTPQNENPACSSTTESDNESQVCKTNELPQTEIAFNEETSLADPKIATEIQDDKDNTATDNQSDSKPSDDSIKSLLCQLSAALLQNTSEPDDITCTVNTSQTEKPLQTTSAEIEQQDQQTNNVSVISIDMKHKNTSNQISENKHVESVLDTTPMLPAHGLEDADDVSQPNMTATLTANTSSLLDVEEQPSDIAVNSIESIDDETTEQTVDKPEVSTENTTDGATPLPSDHVSEHPQPSSLKEICNKFIYQQEIPHKNSDETGTTTQDAGTSPPTKPISEVESGEAPMDLDDSGSNNSAANEQDLYEGIYTDIDTDLEPEAQTRIEDDFFDLGTSSQESDVDMYGDLDLRQKDQNNQNVYYDQQGDMDLRIGQGVTDYSTPNERLLDEETQDMDLRQHLYPADNQADNYQSTYTEYPNDGDTGYNEAEYSGYDADTTASTNVSHQDESFINPMAYDAAEIPQAVENSIDVMQSTSWPPDPADIPTSIRFSTGDVKLPSAMQRILSGAACNPLVSFSYQPPVIDNVLISADNHREIEQTTPKVPLLDSPHRQPSPKKALLPSPKKESLLPSPSKIPLLPNPANVPPVKEATSCADDERVYALPKPLAPLMEAPPIPPTLQFSATPLSMPPVPPVLYTSLLAGQSPASTAQTSLQSAQLMQQTCINSQTSYSTVQISLYQSFVPQAATITQRSTPSSTSLNFDLGSIPLPSENPRHKPVETFAPPLRPPLPPLPAEPSADTSNVSSVSPVDVTTCKCPETEIIKSETEAKTTQLEVIVAATSNTVSQSPTVVTASSSVTSITSDSPPIVGKNGDSSVRSVTLPTKTKSIQPVGIASVFRSGDADSKPNTPPSRNDSPESLPVTSHADTSKAPAEQKVTEADGRSGLLGEKPPVAAAVESAPSILSQIAATLSAINTIVGRATTNAQPEVVPGSEKKSEKYKPRPKSKQLERERRRREKDKLKKDKYDRPSSRSSSGSARSSHRRHRSSSDKRSAEGRKGESEPATNTGIPDSKTAKHAAVSTPPTDPRIKPADLPSDPRQKQIARSGIPTDATDTKAVPTTNIPEEVQPAAIQHTKPEEKVHEDSNVAEEVTQTVKLIPKTAQPAAVTPSPNKSETKPVKHAALKLDGAKIDTTSNLEQLSVEALQARLQYLNQVVKGKASGKKAKPATVTQDPNDNVSAQPSAEKDQGKASTSILPAALQNVLKTISPFTLDSLKQVIAPGIKSSGVSSQPADKPPPVRKFMTTVPPELRNLNQNTAQPNPENATPSTGESEPDSKSERKQTNPIDVDATMEPVMPMGKPVLTGEELAALAREEAADREYIQRSCEELRAAQFFDKVASGPPAEEESAAEGGGIPGLTVTLGEYIVHIDYIQNNKLGLVKVWSFFSSVKFWSSHIVYGAFNNDDVLF